ADVDRLRMRPTRVRRLGGPLRATPIGAAAQRRERARASRRPTPRSAADLVPAGARRRLVEAELGERPRQLREDLYPVGLAAADLPNADHELLDRDPGL